MKCQQRVVSVVSAMLFLWVTGVGVSSGYAQESEVAVPTHAQLELNDAGVQAILIRIMRSRFGFLMRL